MIVNALKGSPWGTFTVGATIPIAVLMGWYMRFVRPGQVVEATIWGLGLVLLAVVGGRWVGDSAALAPLFTFNAKTLAVMIIVYGFAASVLPVWLLLAPRDYLSAFIKIGTILALAVGILVFLPPVEMPPLTRFVDGTGPIFAGKIFPFAFITIACGAISGFHALVASGTTPKLLRRESDARMIGYGAMLMESFVAVMAMIAARVSAAGRLLRDQQPGRRRRCDARGGQHHHLELGIPGHARPTAGPGGRRRRTEPAGTDGWRAVARRRHGAHLRQHAWGQDA